MRPGKPGTLLMVVEQNRYNVPVALTREAIDRGRLGRILMAQCNVIWNRWDGLTPSSLHGRLARRLKEEPSFTQVSHFIDLLVWLVGENRRRGRPDRDGHSQYRDRGMPAPHGSASREGRWDRFSYVCAYHRNLEGSLTLLVAEGRHPAGSI